ncbi:MAG: PQQ-binding-like beta-propeller repeat protein [bacterium]|nr:PQQ-binding-like beta-propeller repeat protein [bacterium]
MMRLQLALACAFFAATSLNAAEQWTGFQNGGSLSVSDKTIPTEWSAEKGVEWNVELPGYGQSSPVIWKDAVYLTFCAGENKETYFTRAMNLKTGKTIWEHKLANSTPQEATNYVSKAAPTPVVDESGVVAFFEGGNLIAFDHAGEVRWQRDLVKEYGKIESRHGLASSLEQNDKHVFVWVERSEDPYVLAIEKATGKNAWKSAGVGKTSWSSPRLVPVENTQHLVLSASGGIIGLDPESGKQLWSFDDIANNSTPTPIPLGEGRFLIGASEGRGSQTVSPAKSNGVIQISKNDKGEFQAEFVWTANKATTSFGSPIVAGDNAYFVNRAGVLYCLDKTTGKQKYAQRTPGSIWATPLQTPQGLYLFGKNGITTVVALGDEFDIIAENPLWSEEPADAEKEEPGNFGGRVLYAASSVGGRLVLRRGDRVYCIAAK